MAAKLKLILRKIPWFLLANSAILGFGWLVLPYWLYVLAAVFLYLRSSHERLKFWISALFLVAYPWFTVEWFGGMAVYFGVLFAVAWFLLLGVKQLFFLKRPQAYAMMSGILFFVGSLFFFWRLDPVQYFAALLVFFIFTALLFWEFYSFAAAGAVSSEAAKQGAFIFAAVFSLVLLELGWAVSLLPIGFLSSAAFLFLIFSVIEHSFFDYIAGSLHKNRIVFNGAVLILGTIIVLMFSSWSPGL